MKRSLCDHRWGQPRRLQTSRGVNVDRCLDHDLLEMEEDSDSYESQTVTLFF